MALTEQALPKYKAVPGPDLSKPWQESFPDLPKDEMDPLEKQRIFGGDIARIGELFSEKGLSIPPNLLDRLLVLGEESYAIVFQEFHEGQPLVPGFSITELGMGFVSKKVIEEEAKDDNLEFADILRAYGIHELLHCLEFSEMWESTDTDDDDYINVRRRGWLTARPTDNNDEAEDRLLRTNGLAMLEEGFIDYLTMKITNLDDKIYVSYPGEIKVIKYLVDQFGSDELFFQAEFTRHGLRELKNKMDELFGEQGLSVFGLMYKKYEDKAQEKPGELFWLDYDEVLEALKSLRIQKITEEESAA